MGKKFKGYNSIGEYLRANFSNDFEFISDIDNSDINYLSDITVVHKKCKTEFSKNMRNITKRDILSCPNCFLRKMDKEYVNQELKDFNIILNDNELISSETIHTFKHLDCGLTFQLYPSKLLKDKRCPMCNGETKFMTQNNENIQKLFFDGIEDYTFLDKVPTKGKDTSNILIKHKTCGHEYRTAIGRWVRGDRCPNCKISKKKTIDDFINDVNNIEGYKFIDNNLNNISTYKEKRLILHENCNRSFISSYDNFITKGRRCPHCAKEQLESYDCTLITKYLEDIGIPFFKEYRIEECRNEHPLPFDFAIENVFGKTILIEYDGIQHFKSSGYHTEERLAMTQFRDSIKDKFCQDNTDKYILFRIRYDVKDVIKELRKILLSPFVDNAEDYFIEE